jgi:protease-4
MFGRIRVWFVNLFRAIGNLWRRIRQRRLDYVRLELGGSLPEFAASPAWWQRRFLGMRTPASMYGLRRQLERIAADPQATGMVLKLDGLAAGWATLQSLRDEIGRFRASGKRVVAYLVTASLGSYYVACAADEIVLPPTAFLNILGLRSEVQFFKDALAKVGLAAEVEAVSPYKSAGDQFVNSDISPENREQLERLLDQRFAEIVRAISSGRGKSAAEVQALIDAAPLSAAAALEHGLVDALRYEDELDEQLKVDQRAVTILDWGAADRALRVPALRYERRRVAVVAVEGQIARGTSRNLPLPIPLLGGRQAGSESVIQALRQVERSRGIVAAVLYINSPGGDAYAADLIWREVLRLRQHKPVVVVMGDVAASGGYYIAAPASAILAQPGTLTGSIGVFALRPVANDLFERAGVKTVVLSRGAHSGLLMVGQPLTENERLALRDQIAIIYADFKQRVRDGRTLTEQQLEPIAGGRVWLGAEALQLGLIDQLGGMPEALLRAQELAGLPQDRSAPLVFARGERSWLPPQSFPLNTLAGLSEALDEALQPRIWALLPFSGL